MITPDNIRTFQRFLNLAENDSGSPETDYRSVYIYRDGNGGRKQVTLGRGFTDDGGNLRKVVERYIQKGGPRSSLFKSRLSKFGTGVLHTDTEFIQALVSAAKEPAMRQAQDEVFDEVYMQPALRWAERAGIKTPLGVGVIVDSFLHSGTVPGWLTKKFPERKPVDGGNEKAWVTAYLRARLAWFQRATGPLKTCTFRPLFFLQEIQKGNWNLSCPLLVKGKGRIC